MEKVNRSTIIFKFPQVMPKKATTSLVLKAPNYLPQAVIDELRTAKAQQEQYKAMLGDEYRDYDLVIAQINGRP